MQSKRQPLQLQLPSMQHSRMELANDAIAASAVQTSLRRLHPNVLAQRQRNLQPSSRVCLLRTSPQRRLALQLVLVYEAIFSASMLHPLHLSPLQLRHCAQPTRPRMTVAFAASRMWKVNGPRTYSCLCILEEKAARKHHADVERGVRTHWQRWKP